MIAWFFLGVGLVALLVLALRAYASADPRMLKRLLTGFGGVLAVGLVAYALATGRAGALIGLAVFLIPLWRNWRAMAARAKAALGPTPGQVSTAETDWLSVTLDHDTGAMGGTVRQGEFAGRALDDLTADELGRLREACADDGDSVRLLDAYCDRRFGSQDRDERDRRAEEETPPRPSPPSGMSEDEACSILGVKHGAGEEDIRAAHRRLMLKLHPDQGGSDWLAARINQAKDLLLKRARESG